jgi:hypothetical protein
LNGSLMASDLFLELKYETPTLSVVGDANIEAKRMHADKRDTKELEEKFAAQIFCEMLGQTCHPEFYEREQSEYQEVIHELEILMFRPLFFILITVPSEFITPSFPILISKKLFNTDQIISRVHLRSSESNSIERKNCTWRSLMNE